MKRRNNLKGDGSKHLSTIAGKSDDYSVGNDEVAKENDDQCWISISN